MLSLINPSQLKDPGIYVDNNLNFENETCYNPTQIKWIFYGIPYEHIIHLNGSIESKYGIEHSIGHVVSIENYDIKYDLLYGMWIERVEIINEEYFDISSSDSDVSESEYESKKNLLILNK